MNSIINELKVMGIEFKKSRVVFSDTFNCLDIFKNGERVMFISPRETQPLITSDGKHWNVQEIFMEYYNLDFVEFFNQVHNCTIEEFYKIKRQLKELGVIKVRKNKSTDEIDKLFESDKAEKLSPYLSIVEYKNMWVARDTTDYTPDCCIETEILFIDKPTEDLFYQVSEMVENIC